MLGICIAGTLATVRPAFASERKYVPRQCVFSEAIEMPRSIAIAIYWSLMIVSLLSLFTNRVVSGLIVFLSLALLIFDHYIWAPHLLQFCCAALALHFDRQCYLNVFFVALYFYGGIQKMNSEFARRFVATFLGPFLCRRFGIDQESIPSVPWLGYAAAASETLFGVLLIVASDQNLIFLFGVGLHASILYVICFESSGFHGIAAWNIHCLFWSASRAFMGDSELWSDFEIDWILLIELILFGIVPILNLLFNFGERISFKMHSQNQQVFSFLVERKAGFDLLPHEYLGELEEDHSLFESHFEFYLRYLCLCEAYLMPPLSVRSAARLARNIHRLHGLNVLVYDENNLLFSSI